MLVSAFAAAGCVAAFAPAWLSGTMRAVAAYDAAAAVVLLWQWTRLLTADSLVSRRHAEADDPGGNAILLLTLVAVVFGFVAAITILGRGQHLQIANHQVAADLLGFGAVTFGWLLIHTTLAFHYARAYYVDRGHIFPGKADPSDLDFSYFSFVIGMTFQVSDVQVASPRIRRVVMLHGMASFAYNTAILALVVNLASNLLH